MSEKQGDTARAIWGTLQSPNELDSNLEPANVVDGLFAIARALDRVARAIDRLGTNDASTSMGALENRARDDLDAN